MPSATGNGWFTALCAAAAAVAVPSSVYLLLSRQEGRRQGRKPHTAASTPVEEWCAEEVLDWLNSLGVSPPTMKNFEENNVDGSVLFLLGETDLPALAPKVGDAVRIREGLRKLRSAHPSQRPVHQASQQVAPQKAEDILPTGDDAENRFINIVQEVDEIRALLESQDFRNARPEWQTGVRQACARRLAALCQEKEQLPAALQAKVAPLISGLQATFTCSPNQGEGATLSAPSPALEKQLKSLHDMVDDFVRVLDGTTVDMESAPVMQELQNQVGVQISRVAAVARRLPAEYGEPLLNKCEAVIQRLQRRGSQSAAAAADGTHGGVPTLGGVRRGLRPANFDLVLNQLRSLFTELKSSVLGEPDARRRLDKLMSIKTTLGGILQEAATWDDSEATAIINSVASRVSSVFEQMEALTREELSSHGGGGTGAPRNEGEADNVDGYRGERGDDIPVTHVVANLQAIIQVLHSDELMDAPVEVQQQTIGKLGRKLTELHQRMERAPRDETNLQIMTMIETAQGLIGSVADGSDDGDETPDETSSNQRWSQRASMGRGSGELGPASGGAAHSPGSTTNGLAASEEADLADEAVVLLEKVFEYINSGAFDALPPDEQGEAARQNLNQLQLIEQKCRACGGQQQLMGIIAHIKGILQQKARQGSNGETRSQLFLASSACVEEIQSLLDSSAFKSADAGKRKSFALCLLPQLQNVMSSLPHMEPTEAEMMHVLIAPISEALEAASTAPDSTRDVSVSASVNPLELISRMEEIRNVLESEEFRNASARQRRLIVSRLVVSIGEIREQCLSLGEIATPLLPIVQEMHTQLQNVAAYTGDEAHEESGAGGASTAAVSRVANADDGSGDDDNEESGDAVPSAEEGNLNAMLSERLKLFRSVADIADRLRRSNMEKFTVSMEELEPLQGLLAMVYSVGISSNEERSLRDEFEAQLGEAMNRANAAVSTSNDVEDVRALPATLLKGTPPARVGADERVREALRSTRERANLNQGSPRHGQVQDADVVARMSYLQDMLDEATCRIHENPPQNEEELRPYLSLLREAGEEGDRLPINLLLGFKELENSVVDAAQSIPASGGPRGAREPGMQAQEDTSNGDFAEGDAEESVTLLLLDISNRLREGSVSDERLDELSAMLDCLDGRGFTESFRHAVESVRQQLELQRVVNRNNAEESSLEDEEDDNGNTSEVAGDISRDSELDTSNKGCQRAAASAASTLSKIEDVSEVAESSENSASPTSAQGPDGGCTAALLDRALKQTKPKKHSKGKLTSCLEKLQKNVVPGGKKAELTLLPRLEERLLKEEQHFIENTTLADIQNISKLILHLQANNDVKRNSGLKSQVNRLKEKFARQLVAFKGSDQQAAAVRSKLRLQCHDGDAFGRSVRNLVICTGTEAEAPGNEMRSDELLRSLTEGKAAKAEVPSDVVKEWAGRSVALIFCEANSNEGTVLCELLMLQEVLVNRYGFDVYLVNYGDPSKAGDLLQEVAALDVKRLFLYFVTGDHDPLTPHAITFRNGSTLPYQDVINTVDNIDRVVLAHCQPLRLNVVSTLVGCDAEVKDNSLLSVVITEDAAVEIRPVRCWLYDGLLTPAVTELLSLDEERVLCPEDLVMYVVTALSSHIIDFGSFMEREPLGMGFFSPIE